MLPRPHNAHTHTHTCFQSPLHIYLRLAGGDMTPTKPATDAVRYGATYTCMRIADRAPLWLASTNVTSKAKLSVMLRNS